MSHGSQSQPSAPWQLITTASADQPLKGTQHLIPAFASLTERFPKLRLMFIGRPKPGGETEKLIDRHRVADKIRFVHGIGADEIRHLANAFGRDVI